MKIRTLSTLAFLLLALNAFSQIDREFWFAAPTVDDAGVGFDKPVLVRVTSFAVPATVIVSIPSDPTFVPLTLNLLANSTQSFDLTAYVLKLKNVANVVTKNGLLIQSNADITAYYEVVNSPNCICNPEIFSLKGKNALGTNFMISFQNTYANDTIRFPNTTNSFDIVATENNTVVTITPSKSIIGHLAGVPFQITLNKGETYSAVAVYRSAYAHLDGSTVTSDKLIAVTLKDDLVFGDGACADLIGDQTVPINVLGNQYVVAKGSLMPKDRVFVLATEDNTAVSINGVATTNLMKGQTYTFQLQDPNVYIVGSKKVYVYHVTGYGCELGSAVIPKLTCTGSTSISIVRSSTQLFSIIITAKTALLNSFTLNGNAAVITAANFTPVAGTAGMYSTANIDLTGTVGVNQVANIQNTMGRFSLGLLNGADISGARYGYFSDFKSSNISRSEERICEKDSVQLTAFGGISYAWTPAAGLSNPAIANPKASPNAFSTYTVVITTVDGCVDSATVNINVKKKPDAVLTGNSICKGQTGTLHLAITAGTGPYSITYTDATNTPHVQNNILANTDFPIPGPLTATTLYTLTQIVDSNGCKNIAPTVAQASIVVNPLPITSITPDTLVCQGISFPLRASGGSTYLWSPAIGLSSTMVNNPQATVTQPVKYYVQVTDANKCVARDSVSVAIAPAPIVDAGNGTSVCRNAIFMLQGTSTDNHQWHSAVPISDPLSLTPETSITQTTVFYLLAENAQGCRALDSVTINLQPIANFALMPGDTSICEGRSVKLLASGGSIYTWDMNSGLSNTTIADPIFTPTADATLSVTIEEAVCHEKAVLQTIIRMRELPTITATRSVDLDCSNQVSQLNATGGRTYEWTPTSTVSNATISNPIAQPSQSTIYTVNGTDAFGCSSSDTALVRVDQGGKIQDFLPTAFTPNGDGKNDCIGFRTLSLTKGFEMSIFNRWGERVFFTTNSSLCWNGYYKGQLQPSDVYVYFYKIKTECGDLFKKGTLALIK